jgi:MerR family transcriptional regulator, light-induced transcriptional regulator
MNRAERAAGVAAAAKNAYNSPVESYDIVIQGHLNPYRARSFVGFTITLSPAGHTLLSGAVPDQAALSVVLDQIAGMGLPILSVQRKLHAPAGPTGAPAVAPAEGEHVPAISIAQAANPFKVIEDQKDMLAAAVAELQFQGHATGEWPYRPADWSVSVRDVGYHLSYLGQALAAGDPALFLDYVAWAKVLFAGLGFVETMLADTLESTRAVLRERLPHALAVQAGEYVREALAGLPEMPAVLPSYLDEETPLRPVAREYLDMLLRSQREGAGRLILDQVSGGVDVRDIYLHVFQPAQVEIGRLWQMQRLSVAQEHYCTHATQQIMSQIHPHAMSAERSGRRLVATSVGDELHEVGIRMVADFFEMAGWDAYYLGANTPANSVLQTLQQQPADVLAISATITFHVDAVAELIARVRAAANGKSATILVGGYPFNLSPGLWRQVGADGWARDARGAVVEAERLLAG